VLATGYTLSATTTLDFESALERTREELAAEGFGVLCEIDVQATLKQKLGADRALAVEPEIGTLLPCNVVVFVDSGTTHVSAIDAERMLAIVGRAELAPVAGEVRERLARVVERVAGA